MKLATVLVASILSLATFNAQADSPTDDSNSMTVKFGDLDLNREAGIARLYVRIKGAARQVCYQPAEAQLVAKQTYAECVKHVVTETVARIGRPMLTEYVAQLSQPAPASLASR